MNTKIDFGKALKDAWNIMKSNLVLLVVANLVAVVVGGFTSGIATCAMEAGLFAICLRLIDGDATKPTIGDVFGGFSFFLPTLIVSIIGSLGFLACCVGQLVTLPIAIWAVLRIVDTKGTDGFAAFKEIFATVKSNGAWMWLVWVFVASFISGLGVIACYVGLFVTLPMFNVIMACMYRQVFPKQS